MLEWAVFICVALYTLHRVTKHHLSDQLNAMFPGPKPWPIIGNIHEGIGRKDEVFKKLYIVADMFRSTFCLWLGPKPYLVVTDPVDAEAILGSSVPLDKADVYRFLRPWMGSGLITSSGDHWKHHRKLLTPAFHFSILEKFIEVFASNDDVLSANLMKHDGGNYFDVFRYIKMYAIDNICEAAMGQKIDAQINPTSSFVQAMERIMNIIYIRTICPLLRPDWLLNMSPYGSINRSALQVLHGFTDEVIRMRKLTADDTAGGSKCDDNNMKRRLAFLDVLLAAAEGGNMSDEDIRDEVNTFMFAGQDTITSSLSFAIYNIADNKDIQERAYKEQWEIFGETDRRSTYKDLQEMRYLEQIIKESMRTHPGVPIIGRTIVKEFPLSNGRLIPEGCEVMICIAAIHRNPDYWHNPSTFNPDNFTPEAVQRRHPYAFLPFSAGPRNCIGQKYAVLEMKSALSMIIRKFHLSSPTKEEDKPKLYTDLTLSATNGVNIRIHRRTVETQRVEHTT